MVKMFKRMLLIMSFIIIAMLTGCSGSFSTIAIDTELTVDTSFNGSRVMTAQIPSSVFKSVFSSDAERLEEVISEYSPSDMYCIAVANEDGGATIQMCIDFATRAEYQTKIENICAGNTGDDAITPKVTFDYSRSMLKKGYTIVENFTSLDLFYWLFDALKEEYSSLQKKDFSDVFVLGSTCVNFDGETVEMDDYIQISTIESTAFNSICITARYNSDQSVDATVTYVVSNKVVASLGERLDTLMSGIVPSDGNLTYQDGDSERAYTLTISASSVDNYVSDMNEALKVSNTIFDVYAEGDSESLSATMSITQYYDGSYFLDFTNEDTSMSYVLIVSSDYTVDSCEGTYGFLISESSVYGTDTCEITLEISAPEEVTTVLGFAVDIDEVDVTTTVHSDTNIERSIDFKLSSEADALIGASILERLETAATSWEDVNAMTVSKESLISSIVYTIVLKADSAEELTQLTLAVLGTPTDEGTMASVISGGTQARKNPWRIDCSYEDTLNFSVFLKGSMVTGGIHYTFNYPSGYKAGFDGENVYEDALASGNTITCSTYNKVLTVHSAAKKTNVEGIMVLVFFVASIVCMLVIVILNTSVIFNLILGKKPGENFAKIFGGRNLTMLVIGVIAVLCFIFMGLRLLFRVY